MNERVVHRFTIASATVVGDTRTDRSDHDLFFFVARVEATGQLVGHLDERPPKKIVHIHAGAAHRLESHFMCGQQTTQRVLTREQQKPSHTNTLDNVTTFAQPKGFHQRDVAKGEQRGVGTRTVARDGLPHPLELQRIEIIPSGIGHDHVRKVECAAARFARLHFMRVKGQALRLAMHVQQPMLVDTAIGRRDRSSFGHANDQHILPFDRHHGARDRATRLCLIAHERLDATDISVGAVPSARAGDGAIIFHANEQHTATGVRDARDCLNQVCVVERRA